MITKFDYYKFEFSYDDLLEYVKNLPIEKEAEYPTIIRHLKAYNILKTIFLNKKIKYDDKRMETLITAKVYDIEYDTNQLPISPIIFKFETDGVKRGMPYIISLSTKFTILDDVSDEAKEILNKIRFNKTGSKFGL